MLSGCPPGASSRRTHWSLVLRPRRYPLQLCERDIIACQCVFSVQGLCAFSRAWFSLVQMSLGGCAAAWAQCGGQGFSGPTCCASGNKCVYGNPWYSQCKPCGAGETCTAPGDEPRCKSTDTKVENWQQCGGAGLPDRPSAPRLPARLPEPACR